MMWYASHQTFSQHLLHVKKGRPGTIHRQVIGIASRLGFTASVYGRMRACVDRRHRRRPDDGDGFVPK
jgi:hypothetical protein